MYGLAHFEFFPRSRAASFSPTKGTANACFFIFHLDANCLGCMPCVPGLFCRPGTYPSQNQRLYKSEPELAPDRLRLPEFAIQYRLMTPWIAIVLVALVAIAALWMAQTAARRQSELQATALRQEMQNILAVQSQAVSAQLSQLTQSVIAQLGQVAQQVQSGMASTSTLASDAQKAVSERLQASTDMISAVQQKLGEMQEAGRELSEAAKQIENVLGGAKSRGTLGEVALDRILADTLPIATYEVQHRFATGEIVDAIVRLPDHLLPIDSKFPLDDYRRLIDVGEEARKGFAQAVRTHADSIAKKYILPGEGTLDIALMFVPSEGVYYELLRSVDPKGTVLDEYCRNKRRGAGLA